MIGLVWFIAFLLGGLLGVLARESFQTVPMVGATALVVALCALTRPVFWQVPDRSVQAGMTVIHFLYGGGLVLLSAGLYQVAGMAYGAVLLCIVAALIFSWEACMSTSEEEGSGNPVRQDSC